MHALIMLIIKLFNYTIGALLRWTRNSTILTCYIRHVYVPNFGSIICDSAIILMLWGKLKNKLELENLHSQMKNVAFVTLLLHYLIRFAGDDLRTFE